MSNIEAIKAALAKHALTVEAVFVPWSQSRNKGEKDPSLNWRVTLKRDGREIVSTNYSAGFGHCPSYDQGARRTVAVMETIKRECETGRPAYWSDGYGAQAKHGGKPILPKPEDVVYSLINDAEGLDYSTYEEFASNFGYDPDSRKGEAVYRAMLEIGLKMRNGLGEAVLAELREVFQDY